MLNKNRTMALHGIAILMMIYHHLFIGGNAWALNEGTSLFSVFDTLDLSDSGSAQMGFAWFCKICVAIFAFTSGYAMFIQLDNKKCFREIMSYLPKRLWSFYKKYLLAFLFFVGCSYFMTDGFDFSLSNFIPSLLGLKASYNGTWWYVSVYYLMIIVSPFLYLILKKINYRGYLAVLAVFVICALVAVFTGNAVSFYKNLSLLIHNNTMVYLLIFAEGMFCARYGIVDYIGNKLNLFTSLILLVTVYILRSLLIRAPSDPLFDLVFITPYIVATVKLLSYSNKLNSFFGYFGKYSAYMWYSHAYFYAYLFFVYVEKCDASILVYLQVVFYSLVCAIAFTGIEEWLKLRINTRKQYPNNKCQ